MKQKITTCIVYVCASISSLCLLLGLLKCFPGVYRSTQLALIASGFAPLTASVIVFRWPRVSHWLGLVSGLGALYWFYGVEFGYSFPALNTWVTFNLPDAALASPQEILIAKLKIAFAIAALAATTLSVTRLLPAHWTVRKRPVQDLLWPTIAVCILAIVLWYAISVSPYRIPVIVDGVPAKLTLLHVEKNSSQFHETSISVFRDGKVYLFHNDRRLLRYRFAVQMGSAVLSEDSPTGKAVLALGEDLANGPTAAAIPLRSRNAEGWYVRTEQRRVFAFTTENGIPPSPELLGVFRELESLVPD